MASIGEAVRQQLDELIADLLAQDARTLTGMGISKQRRNYFKNSDVTKKKKLPPTDAGDYSRRGIHLERNSGPVFNSCVRAARLRAA
jgi:hypothetical protein